MNIPELEQNQEFKKLFESINIKTERGYAWIDLNTAFVERKDKKHDDEYLAKELHIFLANWGMFRNSFLMEHNYRILIPAVQILIKSEYEILQDPEINTVKNNVPLILNLKEEINGALKKYTPGKKYVTQTLLSKITMGALGCTVAYDNYVISALRDEEISPSFCKKSIEKICDFYEKNETEISKLRQKYKMPDGKLFPPMKFLDLLFWASALLKSHK